MLLIQYSHTTVGTAVVRSYDRYENSHIIRAFLIKNFHFYFGQHGYNLPTESNLIAILSLGYLSQHRKTIDRFWEYVCRCFRVQRQDSVDWEWGIGMEFTHAVAV